MRFLRVFDFQVNYMLHWRFHFEKGIPRNCSFIHYELEHIYIYILDFGTWRWSALNMGYMNKSPSIPVIDNMHEGQTESWRTTPWYWRNYNKGQLLLCWSGGHWGREAFGKRCPDRVGREAKSFRGQWRWWAPPTSVTPDRARWGSFSVRLL